MMARRVHIGLVLLVLAALLVSPSICLAQSSAGKAETNGEKGEKLPEKPKDEDVRKDDGKGSDDYDSFVDKDGDRVDDRWQGFSKKEDRDRDRDQDRARDKERDQEQDRERVKDNDSRAKDDARKPSPPKKIDNSGGSGKRGR
jgi:hypothetical protein